MTSRRTWLVGLVAAGALAQAGCSSCSPCRRSAALPPVVTNAPPPGAVVVAPSYKPVYPPPSVAPPPGASLYPAAPVPGGYQPGATPVVPADGGAPPPVGAAPGVPPYTAARPPAAHQPPVAAVPGPVATRPLPQPPPKVADYPPPPDPPTGGGAKLLTPDPGAAPGTKLLTPVTGEDPLPGVTERRVSPADMPADIPQYNLVYDQVAAGLQPFPEGFGWLKDHGYRTVLNLRAGGEDDTAARTQAEAQRLTYRSLEVGPPTLNRDLVRQFGRLVADRSAQPLFVYDRKGVAAGALWYLHFRLNENVPETQARAQAARLGLPGEINGDAAEWWLAINKVLGAAGGAGN